MNNMTDIPQSVRKPVWTNITFFTVTTLVAVIGGPLYALHVGLSPFLIGLTVFYIIATGLGITVGYHRLFAHRNFQASKIVRFFVLFFGAAAFEQSALKWACQHRDHHKYVDTDLDPYSIKKGFWYAHIGWLIFWRHKINFDNAKDLQQDPMLMHQHKYYLLWSVGSCFILPMILGALNGEMLGALIFASCVRLTFVYHSTFCINSVCHMFGKATYDIYASARDHWFVALLTFGEGYHNFHHRFPTDYRNGVRWYHWDPSKWLIAALTKVGLVRNINRVSKFRILDAKLAADFQRSLDRVKQLEGRRAQVEAVRKSLTDYYENLKLRLAAWENAAREYQALVVSEISRKSTELRANARMKMFLARERFEQSRQNWKALQLQHLGISFA